MQQQGNISPTKNTICSNRVIKSMLYGIFCRGNVQLAVSIESMFEIVICDIGNKQCEELNFCGVVEVSFQWVD